jgi:ribosomal protein S12 methylthiotransferase accessory factor
VYFPSNLIENLYASNGMSAGNTLAEAQVQCLSEIFERAVKREILEGELALPDVPQEVLAKYPGIVAGIRAWKSRASRCWSRMRRWAAPIRSCASR